MSAARTVLILDDEVKFARFLANVVTELGYEALVTHSSRVFRQHYAAMAPPDFIFLDIVMPEEDGIEMTRWLVEQGCPSRIVIISGYNPVFAKAAEMIGRKAGGMTITRLQKPVKLATLRAILTDGPEPAEED